MCQRMLVASAGSERRCRARVAVSAPRSVGLEKRNGFPGVLCALALHDKAHHIRLPRGAHALGRSIPHADVGRRRSSGMQEQSRAGGCGTDPARRVAGLDLGVKPLKKGTHVCILLPHAPLGSRLPRGRGRRDGCGAACKAPLPAHRPHRLARQRAPLAALRDAGSPGALARGSCISHASPHPAWRGTHHRKWRDAVAGNQWPAARAPAPIALGAKSTARAPISRSQKERDFFFETKIKLRLPGPVRVVGGKGKEREGIKWEKRDQADWRRRQP
jgi:hypothetical protein